MGKLRYIVQIRFKDNDNPIVRFCDIYEPVKTLIEANRYESIINDSVARARIVDAINETVVKEWR